MRWPCGGDGRDGRVWPPPEIAELLELSGQLRRACWRSRGGTDPRWRTWALADWLAAHVLAERHGGRKQESGEQHVAINALLAESGEVVARPKVCLRRTMY